MLIGLTGVFIIGRTAIQESWSIGVQADQAGRRPGRIRREEFVCFCSLAPAHKGLKNIVLANLAGARTGNRTAPRPRRKHLSHTHLHPHSSWR